MQTLQTLDYVAFILYMLLMAGVGTFFGWFIKDIKGYFKGGNTIPWGIAAISNFMGLFSTFVFVAYAGIAYEDGIVGVTVLWCTVPPGIIAAFFLAKKWRRSGIITPVEYLETRFNNSVRQLFSWTGLFMRFLDNMVRLYAIGIFLMTATPLTFFQAIVIAGLAITLFTIVGGVWAVVVLDTLQFVILVFASLILVPLSLEAVGGLNNLAQNHPDHFDWFHGPKGVPIWLIVYYLMVTLKYNANWAFIQRFYSVKDEKSSQKLGFLTATLFFIFPIFFLLPAIAAVEILPNLPDPEMAYVATAVKLLPAGLMGLMLAAMFSATMSSLNSEFNVMSGVLTNDVYKRLFKPDASDNHYVWVARINMILVGLIVLVGAMFVGELGGAFEANKLLTGLFAIPVAIPLIFGLIMKKPRPLGAIITVIVGLITGLVLNAYPQVPWEYATLISILVCFFTFVISGLFESKKQEYKDRVKAFFEKINTPLTKEEKPKVDPAFERSLAKLFAIALSLSGLLFIAMSIPSVGVYSGNVGMLGGFLCFLIAVILYFLIIKPNRKETKNND